FKNKRGSWSADIPTTGLMVRRSDDSLVYDCTTSDGRKASGQSRSDVEGEKVAASIIFWDLGITDAINDKHRTYLRKRGHTGSAAPNELNKAREGF
ncbi:MAG: hypothetical protein RML32_11125, partial [Gammaproteobacteria bacterium]|nr:hypothetical protein [Gammaproteobacteria bacterium]